MATRNEHSPNDSVSGNSAPVQVTRITLPPPRDLIIGTLLAFSLLCNIFLYAYAKDAKTIALVANDALEKFMANQLPELKSRIEVTEELTKTYGLKESIEHSQDQVGKRRGR